MPVMLFVHGVANRDSPEFEGLVKRRDARFTTVLGGTATILNPYWGGSAAKPAWGCASVPDMDKQYKALGLGGPKPPVPPKDAVLVAARADFPATVATLSVADLATREQAIRAATTGVAKAAAEQELADAELYWARAAAYSAKSEKPAWLKTVRDDAAFFAELTKQSQPPAPTAPLGLLSKLKIVAKIVGGVLADGTNETAARAAREYSPDIAIFLGDAFCYLKQKEQRDTIRKIVLTDLEAAAKKAHDTGDKLILAGHSFGGIILYDLLTDEEAMKALETKLGFPLKADLFLTVGSQVALFEELKVYSSSNLAIPGNSNPKTKLKRPARVERWWNAFDRMDVLSFLVEEVFDGAQDFYVDTAASVMSAHSAYFYNATFYQRLNKRLKDASLA